MVAGGLSVFGLGGYQMIGTTVIADAAADAEVESVLTEWEADSFEATDPGATPGMEPGPEPTPSAADLPGTLDGQQSITVASPTQAEGGIPAALQPKATPKPAQGEGGIPSALQPKPAQSESSIPSALQPKPTPKPTSSAQPIKVQVSATPPRTDKTFALLYIPRLGDQWVKPVIQGVGTKQINRGIGHFPKSQLPGQIGNFAMAGHRMTHGNPLRQIHTMKAGDKVYVRTQTHWLTYTYRDTKIVRPDRVDIVAPVPGKPGVAPKEALLTLSACDPWWSSEKRMIVTAVLSEARTIKQGPPKGAPAIAFKTAKK